MDNQRNINQVQTKFFHENKDAYDAEVTVTVQCKDKQLRKLTMDSLYVDNQEGQLYFEASSQDPDSLPFTRRVCVKKLI